MKFRKTTAAIIASGVIAISGAAFTMPKVAKGEIDLPGIDATLQNHEARISNNEKDIQALQNSTTPNPDDHVPVPPSVIHSTPVTNGNTPVPPASAPATPVAPTKIITSRQLNGTGQTWTCTYQFDDGSSLIEQITPTPGTVPGTYNVPTLNQCKPVGTVVPS